ncbi:MAG: hypothetical protein NZ108_07260, partial [Bacteroidia bacterium]|nr:hypothetical protein [Bacteroidia bacterium]
MHLLNSDLTVVESDDDDCNSPNGLGSIIENRVLAPGTYFIVVQGFNTATGTYTLNATLTPTGIFDEPACASPLTLTSGVACIASGTTVGSTVSPQTNSCGGGADVWYSVTVPSSGHLVARLQGGTLAGRTISIFSNPTTEVNCSSTDRAEATGLTPGSTAYIRISGTTPGTFSLFVNNGVGVTITWNGSASSDWFNSNNWSLCTYPDRTISVIIPSSSNNPNIMAGLTGSTRDLTITTGNLVVNAGATVSVWGNFTLVGTITNSGTLRAKGDVTSLGGLVSGVDRIILDGTGTQVLGLTSALNTNEIDTLIVNKPSGVVNCNTTLYVNMMDVSASSTVNPHSVFGIFLRGTLTNAGTISTTGRFNTNGICAMINTGTVNFGLALINHNLSLTGRFSFSQVNHNAPVTGSSTVLCAGTATITNSWSGDTLSANTISNTGNLIGSIVLRTTGGGIGNYGTISTTATVISASSGTAAYRNPTKVRNFIQQSGVTMLYTNLQTDSLTIAGGYINGGASYLVDVQDGGAAALTYVNGFINGKLRRAVSGTGAYDFPVSAIGKGNNRARVIYNTMPSLTALEAIFYASAAGWFNNLMDTNGDVYNGPPLNNGYVTLTPIGGSGTFDLQLYNDGYSYGGSATAFTALRFLSPMIDG